MAMGGTLRVLKVQGQWHSIQQPRRDSAHPPLWKLPIDPHLALPAAVQAGHSKGPQIISMWPTDALKADSISFAPSSAQIYVQLPVLADDGASDSDPNWPDEEPAKDPSAHPTMPTPPSRPALPPPNGEGEQCSQHVGTNTDPEPPPPHNQRDHQGRTQITTRRPAGTIHNP